MMTNVEAIWFQKNLMEFYSRILYELYKVYSVEREDGRG
jgi:hypothetical protein